MSSVKTKSAVHAKDLKSGTVIGAAEIIRDYPCPDCGQDHLPGGEPNDGGEYMRASEVYTTPEGIVIIATGDGKREMVFVLPETYVVPIAIPTGTTVRVLPGKDGSYYRGDHTYVGPARDRFVSVVRGVECGTTVHVPNSQLQVVVPEDSNN